MPHGRWRCCGRATTCCPSTCATSPATCCATASCSPTRRWRPAWTPTACSTTSFAGRRCRASSWRTSRPLAEPRRAVTFREPLLLAGLALIPLAVAAYVAAQRRRRRFAVRYTNVDLLAGVARASWLRHLPTALALLALAALVVALARPERTVAAQRRDAVVVMVTDTSGSMLAKDVRPDRLTAAREAARALSRQVPEDFRLGLVKFGSAAEQVLEPTTDRTRMELALRQLSVKGATAMGDGLALGLE